MFQVAVSETYWTSVRVDIPADNGHKKPHIFKAEFKRLDQDQLDDMNDRLAAGELKDQQVIDEVMVNWADVTDMHRQPLPFTPDNLALVLKIHPTRATIVKTFFDTVYGSARKN